MALDTFTLPMTAPEITPKIRRDTALHLLRHGIATPHEVSAITGQSRQLIRYWCKAFKIDWRTARAKHVARHWRSVINQQ